MNSLPQSAISKPTRRTALAWGGVLVGGSAAAILGWRLALGARHHAGQTAVAAPPVRSPNASASEAMPVADSPLRHEIFSSLLNQTFHIGEAGVPCQLVEVSAPQTAETIKGTFVTFSLIFEAPPRSISPDGEIQQISHSTAGRFEMFLAPVGKPGRVQFLQAVCSARVV